jgi:hypothetical protein
MYVCMYVCISVGIIHRDALFHMLILVFCRMQIWRPGSAGVAGAADEGVRRRGLGEPIRGHGPGAGL